MAKKNKLILAILSLPILLCGCWDYVDINRRDIVISIGIDYKKNKIQLIGESAKLTSPSQNKGMTQITSTYTYSSFGKNFDELRASQNAKTPHPVFLGAIRTLAFSKAYAKKGIQSYINRIFSIGGFRNSVLVVISKESAKELFNKKINNDISVGYGIQDTVLSLYRDGGALYKTVQHIVSDNNVGCIGYFLPYVTVNKHSVNYLGLCAMKKSKLVGIVNLKDSTGFMLILGKKPSFPQTLPYPGGTKDFLSVKSIIKKRNYKTFYKNKKVHIYINLKVISQLQYEYSIQPLTSKSIKELTTTISNNIKKIVLSATDVSKKKFKSDVFGFARYFRAQNSSIFRHINWDQKYQHAIFHVKVSTKIINTNLLDLNSKKPK